MRIRLSVSDTPHRETVTVYLEGPNAHRRAREDQTIHGSRWETPRDMPHVAYACLLNEPGLLSALNAEGYTFGGGFGDLDWKPPILDCATAGCDGGPSCPMRGT